MVERRHTSRISPDVARTGFYLDIVEDDGKRVDGTQEELLALTRKRWPLFVVATLTGEDDGREYVVIYRDAASLERYDSAVAWLGRHEAHLVFDYTTWVPQ